MGIMASPHKHPRTGVYYFRMGVPKELRDTIGKTEFKTSLRTKNLKDAKRLFPAHLEEAQKQIELAKLKLLGSSDIELNAIDCAIIAERWYEHVKADLDATGAYRDVLKLTRGTDGSIHEFGLSDTLPLSGYEIETATNIQLQELAEHLKEFMLEQLDREGLVVSVLSDSFRRLAVAFYHYVHRLEALCRARHKRDFGYDPISTPIAGNPLSVSSPTVKQVSTSPRGAQNPISKVFARYVESATLRGKAPQSLSEYGLQIDRLIEVIGDIDVTEVTRGHISTLRDTLLQLPKSKAAEIRGKSIEEQIELAKAKQLDRISPSTVDNCLRKTSSVFGYAFELGLIDVNPHKGVSKAATQKRTEFEAGKGYTEAEIALLFKNDLFSNAAAGKPYGMACYWVPLLCLYTGSRVEEMAQLRKSDIAAAGEGIYYFNIREGEGQRVKNCMSVRHVPLHDHLIELGFLDYVNASTEFLFPELKPNKNGKRSPALSKWWSKQVKQAGIVTEQPFHSFRHSLRTRLRSLEVVDSVSDAITGHSPSNVGASYGTVDLQTKKSAIDRLSRLALSRLW